jgi:hypothetical protein
MQFIINGIERRFTPVKEFRQQYQLPSNFGVRLFEPKDYTGLGSIEAAGAELNAVRAAVLAALQPPRPLAAWMRSAPEIAALFHENLRQINHNVHLRDNEIEFAVAGFHDVLQAVVYELIRARAAQHPPASFESLYAAWIHSTIRLSHTVHLYPYRDQPTWEVQVLTHVYGRFGMVIQTVDGTRCVYDAALACPALGYMGSLLAETADAIYRAD